MTTRHVTDIVRDLHGAVLPSAIVTFALTKSSYTGSAAYMRTPITVTTDVNGAYDAILWCDEEGAIATRYQATYPADSFKFDLPVGDGTPVLMSSLRATAPATPVASLQTLLDAALALKAPLASPALTGTPTAPTAAPATNTTQLATTAFTTGALATHEADTTAVHGIADTTKVPILGTQALTDGTTISWDVSLGAFATVTLGGNRTLANPTNLKAGASYVLKVTQDGTGTRTLAYGSVYKWSGGAPVLSTPLGSIDILTFISDGASMFGAILKAFS